MNRIVHDLIVVGAGPAGCMAAYFAAQSGLKVLVVDKQEFPRHKPCAGGLTPKSINVVPFSLDPVVDNSVSTICLQTPGGKSRVIQQEKAICSFVERPNFDLFLLENAQAAGAEFRVTDKLVDIAQTPDAVTLRSKTDTWVARFLIGADGANSAVRRLVFPNEPRVHGFAIEGKVRISQRIRRDRMILDFDDALHGYRWVFPKRDHLNVGLYSVKSDQKLSKTLLAKAFASLGAREDFFDMAGFPIRFGGENYVQKSERVLLVGDAAGMSDVLLGEGIHNALKSGKLAGQAVAEAIAENRLVGENFDLGLRPIRRDLRLGRRIATSFLYPHLRHLSSWAITSRRLGRLVTGGYAAGRTHSEIIRRL